MGLLEFNLDDVESGDGVSWPWPSFTPKEMACKCGCRMVKVEVAFMDRLQDARNRMGIPFKISSGYRCQAHNDEVSHTGEIGPHTHGRAADIVIAYEAAFNLVALAPELGFTGIGVKQFGDPASRYVHLDDLPQLDGNPRPRLWSYPQ